MLVNYYPFGRKGPTYYVAGTVKGNRISAHSLDAVIAAASKRPDPVEPNEKARRRKKYKVYKQWKERQCAKSPHCHWCGCKVWLIRRPDVPLATVDHKIPLHRGGLDQANNWVLACEPCNARRGHDMPEMATATNEAATEQEAGNDE